MKFNKFMILTIIFMAILALGAVNAADNATADNFDASLQNDEVLTMEENDGSLEIPDDSSELDSSEYEEMDKLGLVPVTIDAKVVDNSMVDINVLNATGNVIVIVDTDENTVPLNKDGSASLPLKNISAGNHSLVVIYEGDEVYDAAHFSSVFNIPEKTALIASEFSEIIIGDDFAVTMVLKDINGNIIANVPIKYTIDNVLSNTQTNGKGLFSIVGKPGASISVVYEGNNKFSATNTTLILNNQVVPSVVEVSTHFNISGGVITVKGYAVDTKAGEEGIYFTTQLLDVNGKPVKGVPIQFAVNDKIYDRKTLDDGSFTPYKLNMIRAGRYTMAFFFSGTDGYLPAFASACVDLDKKPITIKASAKTFKASAAKKYAVSLSTIVGSSHDGKAHLSPKKVTLTIDGKTYSANTNNKGKATFNIKITKKGTYSAKINFAGDNTYLEKTKSVKITIK